MSGCEVKSARCQQFIELFEMIQTERMRDVPILNEALQVDAFGFEETDLPFTLGVLLTPWFMNLVLAPQDATQLAGVRVGEKQFHELPAGQFEFIVSYEEAVGPYLACPLFSPMDQFVDQRAALDTAEAVLVEVLKPAEAEEQEAVDQADLTQAAVAQPERASLAATAPLAAPSRRDLLRGFRPSKAVDATSETGGTSS